LDLFYLIRARKVQKDLDIAEYTDPEHNPMIPHVMVLEPGLRYIQDLQRVLVFWPTNLEELRQDLRAVFKEMPSGLDISKPELKAAWEPLNMTAYPYGKT